MASKRDNLEENLQMHQESSNSFPPDSSNEDRNEEEDGEGATLLQRVPARTSRPMIQTQSSGSSFQDFLDQYYSQGSIRGSVFNLCSATLGAGALSVPSAFKSMGIALGLFLLCVCAWTTTFSINLLVIARSRTGCSTYEEITRHLFGPRWASFVEWNIIAICFGTGVAYCKTLHDFVTPLVIVTNISSYAPWMTSTVALIVVWLFLLLPLSLVDSMNELRFASLFGVITIIYLVGAVCYHSSFNIASNAVQPPWSDLSLWVGSKPLDIIQAVPIFMFAFTCQINVFAIFDDLNRASERRMAKVSFRAISLCLLLYACIGVSGFLEFGHRTHGNILNNFSQEFTQGSVGVVLMYGAIAVTIVMAFPLIVHPCRSSIENVCSGYIPSNRLSHAAWTILISGGAIVLSLFVPHLDTVFQLVGGTTSAFICFVLPALFALKMGLYTGEPWRRAALVLVAIM
mmetsp:Transcript_13276/g.46410  ORF Transcript_13276/g.46410 Transcript_13276/m.46410 type:complete len:458 (+) Transcript_13276:54-1427(+)